MLAAKSASLRPAARWNLRRSSPKRSALRGVGMVDMNLLKLGSEFRGTAVVASTEHKVEKFFEGGGVPRSAAQNGFEKADGFLRQTVAGKKIDIGEGLSDELLGLFVKRRL